MFNLGRFKEYTLKSSEITNSTDDSRDVHWYSIYKTIFEADKIFETKFLAVILVLLIFLQFSYY